MLRSDPLRSLNARRISLAVAGIKDVEIKEERKGGGREARKRRKREAAHL